MPQNFSKDPDAVLDYTINWATWLGADTISTSTWTVPAGITKASDTNTITTSTIWLSSGAAGETYNVTNKIVTAADRTEERTIVIRINQH